MIAKDVREWLSQLEAAGDLVKIKEELKLEPDIAALGKAICEQQGPAALCERVYGYNTRVAIGLEGAFRRTAMALGLPKDASFRQIKDKWKTGFDKYPIKSKILDKSKAPCKQNIMKGKDVNLFQFPVPRINIDDASFYFTKTMCITKDPESDWVNMGMYRVMIMDRNKTGFMAQYYQHGTQHFLRARRRGQPLEMCIAYGCAPNIPIVSGSPIPWGWNEFDFAGALRGEPEELVMAETVNIPVPATSEIVLEGILREPAEFEGPFGEFPGGYSTAYMTPVFEVKCVTYRDDPIVDTLYIGRGRTETDYMTDLASVASLEQELKPGFPEITEIAFLTPKFMNCVVQGRWTHRAQPIKVMNAIWGAHSMIAPKMVTVVDEDIDPWNAEEVEWAIGARCQADTDVQIMRSGYACLDPSQSTEELTTLFGINATKAAKPYPRHTLVQYVVPRKEMPIWREKVRKWNKGGNI